LANSGGNFLRGTCAPRSTMRTVDPSASNRSTKCDPMKPCPPVTTTFLSFQKLIVVVVLRPGDPRDKNSCPGADVVLHQNRLIRQAKNYSSIKKKLGSGPNGSAGKKAKSRPQNYFGRSKHRPAFGRD